MDYDKNVESLKQEINALIQITYFEDAEKKLLPAVEENKDKSLFSEEIISLYSKWGDYFFDDGKFEEALAKYEKSYAEKPDEKNLLNIGVCKAEARNYDAAIISFLQLETSVEYGYLACKNIGLCYVNKEDFKTAVFYYEKSIGLKPEYASSFFGLGNIYSQHLNDNEKAIPYYCKAIEKDPQYINAYTNIISSFTKLKKYDEGIAIYKKALQNNVDNSDIHNEAGNLFFEKKDFDKAIECFKKSATADSTNKIAWFNWGLALRKTETADIEDILNKFNKAIECDSSYSSPVNEIWETLKEKQDFKRLKELYTHYTNQQKPASAMSFFRLAFAENELEEYDNAIADYERAYSFDSSFDNALYNKALIYEKINKTDEAIETYSRALQAFPSKEEFYNSIWAIYYNKKTNSEAVDYFYSLIKSASNSLPHIYCSYALINERRMEESADVLEKALKIKYDPVREYYELGNAYLNALAYAKALDCYNEAIKIDKNYVNGYHNKAWIYEKLGNYKAAGDVWQATATLYGKRIESKDYSANDCYYYAEILLYSLQSEDYKKIEALYKQALAVENNHIPSCFSLLKFYRERKRDAGEGEKKDDISMHLLRNEAHMKMLDYFRTGTQLLKKQIDIKATKDNLSDIGDFYLVLERNEDAAKYFMQATELDENFGRAYTGLGVAQVRTEEYKLGIQNFKRAASLDPDDFNIQNNLGDAFRKVEMYDLAEETFKKILNETPYYIDASMGLGEVYKNMGDKAIDNKDTNQAEEYFTKAKELFTKALGTPAEKCSKKITGSEKAALYYSSGYTKVRLYEMKKGIDLLMLQSAENDFRQIRPQHAEFFKADKAIKKIRQRRYSFSTQKAAPMSIFFMAMLVFLAVQYFFFFNRYQHIDVYTIDKKELSSFLSGIKLDSAGPKIESFADDNFLSMEKIQEKLEHFIPAGFLNKPLPFVHEEKKVIGENISETAYGFFTFGAMIFMVVGLFLRDITSLRVGSIQMDKNAVENMNTGSGLGVMK